MMSWRAPVPVCLEHRTGRHGIIRTMLVRWVVPCLGALLVLGLLIWLYRDLDVGKFYRLLIEADGVWLLVLAAAIPVEQFLRAWKWRQILFDLKTVSSLRLFGAVLAGYGVGLVVPLGISPLVRSWLIARLESLRLAAVLMTTAIERFIDGIVFALFAGYVAFAGAVPEIEGDVRTGLMMVGGLNLALFAGLLCLLFFGRPLLACPRSRIGWLVDKLASFGGRRFEGLRHAIRDGIVWPRERLRQLGAVAASVAMKLVSCTYFLWAGLAVGILLSPNDYVFLMVFTGFALVLARFIRVPGGFMIGSGFALRLLGVPDEQALAMVLFVNTVVVALMVGPGLLFLWRSGIDLRAARHAKEILEDAH